jgi:hypothetical protein
LLGQLRPRMRRNRRGGGLSGSISYLGRALKTDPKTLEAAFGAMGLVRPAEPGDKPVFVEIDAFVYWLNQDKNGQTWINARERDRRPETGDRKPEGPPAELVLAADSKPEAQNPESPGGASPLAAVRLLLKETRRGGLAAEVGRLAKELGKAAGELLAALTNAGLRVPEKAREKPVFVEHASEIFWLNRNAKGELWLNAKASKFAGEQEAGKAPAGFSVAEEAAAKKSRRPRKRRDAAVG